MFIILVRHREVHVCVISEATEEGGGITLQPGRRLGNTIPPENISMQN